MDRKAAGGMAGRILRVDLGKGKTWAEEFSAKDAAEYLGGVGIGAKILYEETPPSAGWDHPDNRLVMATGPLAGMPSGAAAASP